MMRKSIIAWMVCLMTFGSGAPQVRAQFVDNGNSPAENVSNRGARAPGQMVQAGIASHAQGPDITQAAPPDLMLRDNLLIALIQGLVNLLSGLVPFVPSFLNPAPTSPTTGGTSGGGNTGNTGSFGATGTVIPVSAAPQQSLAMTELAHNGSVALVEVLNRSLNSLNLEGLRFDDGVNVSPPFPPILMDPGDTQVIQLSGESQSSLADLTLSFRLEGTTSGELALYDFSGIDAAPFPADNAALMLDYLEWSTSTLDPDPPLEAVAVRANLWNEIDFVESALSGMSFRLSADAESLPTTTSQNILVGTFSDTNTLGRAESQAVAPGGPTDTTLNGTGNTAP